MPDETRVKLPRSILPFRYLTWSVIQQTVVQVWRQRLNGLAAEMAYGVLLALFPAILALLTAIGLFEESLQNLLQALISPIVLQDQSLQGILHFLIASLKIAVPDLMWELLRNFVTEVTGEKNRSLFSISFIAAIWIASSAVCTTMNALDQIHRIPRRSRRPFWRSRGIAIVLTVASIVLLAGAAFFVFLGNQLINWAIELLESLPVAHSEQSAYWLLRIWRTLSLPFVFSWVISAFTLMYRLGPSRRQRGSPVLPGSLLGAIAWLGATSLFRIYVDHFSVYNRVYGLVGAFMVLMLWIYLSCLILLIGGQLNVTLRRAMVRGKR
ncbi:MAG: YihY/virulence factor BrkB family protein [Spirulina sp. SIO3F2]|nr:YihY/virulence factor BrkB family protein [Spirulina sp. SIO3F2]